MPLGKELTVIEGLMLCWFAHQLTSRKPYVIKLPVEVIEV